MIAADPSVAVVLDRYWQFPAKGRYPLDMDYGAPYESRSLVSEKSWQRFCELRDWWEQETRVLSNTRQVVNHPAYAAIVSGGSEMLSCIFREISETGTDWVWGEALSAMLGVNAFEEVDETTPHNAVWLTWGRQHGFISADTEETT